MRRFPPARFRRVRSETHIWELCLKWRCPVPGEGLYQTGTSTLAQDFRERRPNRDSACLPARRRIPRRASWPRHNEEPPDGADSSLPIHSPSRPSCAAWRQQEQVPRLSPETDRKAATQNCLPSTSRQERTFQPFRRLFLARRPTVRRKRKENHD